MSVTQETDNAQRNIGDSTEYVATGTANSVPNRVVEGQVLTIAKPRVSLRLFRYGLFPNSALDSIDESSNVFSHYTHSKYSEYGNVQELTTEGAPEVDGFFYGRTPLTSGFLYIIDAENSDRYYEYRVDDSGKFYPIYWKDNVNPTTKKVSDIRNSFKNAVPLRFDADKSIWIAFSRHQWGVAYFRMFIEDETKREGVMLRVDCHGFSQENEGTEQCLPYNQLGAQMYCNPILDRTDVYYHLLADKIEKDVSLARINYEGDLETDSAAVKVDLFITLHSPISCAEDLFGHLEKSKRDLEVLKQHIYTGQSDINDIRQKIIKGYVVKPISKEYSDLVTMAQLSYKLVYSEDKSIEKYDGGQKIGYSNKDTHFPKEYEEEQQRIEIEKQRDQQASVDWRKQRQTGAYSNGYANFGKAAQRGSKSYRNEYEKSIGYGLYRPKVEYVLGAEQRAQIRQEIEEARNRLGSFIKSAYFKQELDSFIGGDIGKKIEGRAFVRFILSKLSENATFFDIDFLTQREIIRSDEWISWVKAIEKDDSTLSWGDECSSRIVGYESMDPLDAILNPIINITSNDLAEEQDIFKAPAWDSTSGVMSGTIVVLMGSWASTLLSTQREIFEVFQKKNANATTIEYKDVKLDIPSLKKVTYNNMEVISMTRSSVKIAAEPFGLTVGQIKEKANAFSPKANKRSKNHRKSHANEYLYVDDFEELAKKGIVFSEADKTLTIALPTKENIVPEYSTYQKVNKDLGKLSKNLPFNVAMSGLQLGGLLCAYSEASQDPNLKTHINVAGSGLAFSEAGANAVAAILKNTKQGFSEKIFARSPYLGAAANVATAVTCALEAMDATGRRDSDASLAWTGASVAFGAASVLGFFFATNPLGWVAILAGVGLIVLAGVLSDTELEYFFKHCILSDNKALEPSENELPGEYTQRMISESLTLLGDKPSEEQKRLMQHPTDALNYLWTLLVCPAVNITAKGHDEYIYTVGTSSSGSTMSVTGVVDFKELVLSYNFTQFLTLGKHIEIYTYERYGDLDDEDVKWEVIKNSWEIKMGEGEELDKVVVSIAGDENKPHFGSYILALFRICEQDTGGNIMPEFPSVKTKVLEDESGDSYLGSIIDIKNKSLINATEKVVTGTAKYFRELKEWE